MRSEFETIALLHENAALLPLNNLQRSVYSIVFITLGITIFHKIIFDLVRHFRSREKGYSASVAWKNSYQLTNLAINTYLGVLGIYHYFFTITRPAVGADRVSGWESLAVFGHVQISYQLWALPVGYYFVNETPSMLAHHLQVIIVSCLASFFTNGFRYVTPFFFGLIEISSVPLSIMNHFKSSPELIDKYPGMYNVIRVVFSFTFLVVRVYMWLPNMFSFLHDCGILCITCDNCLCYAGLGISFVAAVGLTALQLMWASVIIKGLLKLATGGEQKKKL